MDLVTGFDTGCSTDFWLSFDPSFSDVAEIDLVIGLLHLLTWQTGQLAPTGAHTLNRAGIPALRSAENAPPDAIGTGSRH